MKPIYVDDLWSTLGAGKFRGHCLKRRSPLGCLGLFGTMIFKGILDKYGVKLSAGFRLGFHNGLL